MLKCYSFKYKKNWLGYSEGSIILTARDAIFHRVEGLTKGADVYLCKPFSLADLDARVIGLNR